MPRMVGGRGQLRCCRTSSGLVERNQRIPPITNPYLLTGEHFLRTVRSISPTASLRTISASKVNGVKYEGSILIVENKLMSCPPKRFSDTTAESLSIFQILRPIPEILILGCGRNIEPISQKSGGLFGLQA